MYQLPSYPLPGPIAERTPYHASKQTRALLRLLCFNSCHETNSFVVSKYSRLQTKIQIGRRHARNKSGHKSMSPLPRCPATGRARRPSNQPIVEAQGRMSRRNHFAISNKSCYDDYVGLSANTRRILQDFANLRTNWTLKSEGSQTVVYLAGRARLASSSQMAP